MKKLDKEQVKSIYLCVLWFNYKIKIINDEIVVIDETGRELYWRAKHGWWGWHGGLGPIINL